MRTRLPLALLVLTACGPGQSDATTGDTDTTTTTATTAPEPTTAPAPTTTTTTPAECQSNADCPEFCDDCVDGVCVAAPLCEEPPGDECLDDADCPASETCVAGTCEPLPGPEECVDDTDCDPDMICVSGVCEPPPLEPNLPPCNSGEVDLSSETIGGGPSALRLVDTDADQRPDLVYALPGAGIVELSPNDGAGQFPIVATFAVGGPATHLALAPGDLDGDGAPELVVARAGDDPGVLVLTGQGLDFTAGPVQPAAVDPDSLLVADIDGDGDHDVITLHSAAPFVAIRLGDGTGALADEQPAGVTDPVGAQASIVSVSGPAVSDLLVPFPDTPALRVLTGEPDGTLVDLLGFTPATPPFAALAANLDLDGLPDIVSVEVGRVEVWTSGARPGQWSDLAGAYIPDHALRGGHFVEFDAQPGPDLVAASPLPFLVILRGDSTGGFICQTSINLPAATTDQLLAAADIDGDGDTDIVLGDPDGNITTVRQE